MENFISCSTDFKKVLDSDFFKKLNENAEKDSDKIEDCLSLRNALTLYKAFKNEKLREVYLVGNSFSLIRDHYPFLCTYKLTMRYHTP
jgi:hypothetical protein